MMYLQKSELLFFFYLFHSPFNREHIFYSLLSTVLHWSNGACRMNTWGLVGAGLSGKIRVWVGLSKVPRDVQSTVPSKYQGSSQREREKESSHPCLSLTLCSSASACAGIYFCQHSLSEGVLLSPCLRWLNPKVSVLQLICMVRFSLPLCCVFMSMESASSSCITGFVV